MAFAWATVALLVFLLPGFLFLAGLTFPERFTRETAPSSPLGQLAILVSISFFMHAALYAGLGATCGAVIPCPRTALVLATFQLQGSESISLAELGANYARYGPWILLYVLVSGGLGFGLGAVTGKGVVANRLGLRRLARHAWVYDLLVDPRRDGYTLAYVLTRTRQGARVLIYRGILHAFGIGDDGRFRYLVLYEPERFYLHLARGAPVTSAELQAVGGGDWEMPAEWEDFSYLVIDGQEIANTFFKRYSIRVTEEGLRELEEALLEEEV
jgi:hypothetical protein